MVSLSSMALLGKFWAVQRMPCLVAEKIWENERNRGWNLRIALFGTWEPESPCFRLRLPNCSAELVLLFSYVFIDK